MVSIKSILHKHDSLTLLCDKNERGQLLCYGCRQPFSGESADCSNCSFYPDDTCSVCDQTVSTQESFYFCERCWPKSPVFHKSCVDNFPEELQIVYRPGCFFKFMKQSQGSDRSISSKSNDVLDCDFCNNKQLNEEFKYSCGDCDFQICVGCALKLSRYHQVQGRQHCSHRHPLTLLKVYDGMKCKLCYKDLIDGNNPSSSYSYGCAPCAFYIHDSCLQKFEQEIRHPFHPRHALKLKVNEQGYLPCDACCFNIDFQDFRYQCQECYFDLHPECTHLRPSIQYKGHPQHLLILAENLDCRSKCESCGFGIEGIFFMRCVECRLSFHLQCGPYPNLPTSVLHKEHKHRLIPVIGAVLHSDTVLGCDVCGKRRNVNNPFYRCPECYNFIAHLQCVVTDEVEYVSEGKRRHSSHEHILTLHDIPKNDDHIFCNGCGEGLQDQPYGCDLCSFYLHKSCAELPIQVYGKHKHNMMIQTLSNVQQNSTCGACNKHLNGFMYQCDDDKCKFNLDLDCAADHLSMYLRASGRYESISCESPERIQHFSHGHELISFEQVARVDCNLCYSSINGVQGYGCASCEFYIHKSCGGLPQEIQHPFHPQHSLTLKVRTEPYLWCSACCLKLQGLTYGCHKCGFELHLECTSLKTNIDYKGHEHLLILAETMSREGKCAACNSSIWGAFFIRCVKCDLNFHVQCGPFPLPSTVVQEKHIHPLTLSPWNKKVAAKDLFSNGLYCSACSKEVNRSHPIYYCADCKYYVHVRCAFAEVQVHERKQIKHFSHEHTLFPLLENYKYNNVFCCACEEDFQETSTAYGCHLCEFYLHKSCAELPRELQHPFHKHPLILPEPYTEVFHQCNGCHKNFKGFSYSCQDCNFNLDLNCSKLFPSIKNESVHQHTLTFYTKLYGISPCDRCRFTPQSPLTDVLDDYYVRCVKCDFSRHLLCCPLPKTRTHESHPHSLSLKDSFVNIFDGFEDGEFCCDACEERHDAKEYVYHCEECHFVVDFWCLFSEVMHFLDDRNKRRDVELTTFMRNEITKTKKMNRGEVSSYKKIIESLTEEDKQSLSQLEQNLLVGSPLYHVFDELKAISRKAKDEITEALSSYDGDRLKADTMQLTQLRFKDDEAAAEEELFNVGDYKIQPHLAPILKNLLDKYGDISSNFPMTQSLKTMLLIVLCRILKNMRDDIVKNIGTSTIIIWWYCLKLLQKVGLRVDFVLDHVKRMAGAYFLIRTSASSPIYRIHQDKSEISEVINENNTKLECLNERAQVEISSYGNERSVSEAMRLNEALELWWWKKAATGLLDDMI